MQESQVWSLCQEDPLEKEMATHSIFLTGELHGQRSLVGCSPWGRKESDMTKQLTHIHTRWGEGFLDLNSAFLSISIERKRLILNCVSCLFVFLLSLNSRRWHGLAMYCFGTFCHGEEIKQPFPCRKSLRNLGHISGSSGSSRVPRWCGRGLGEWRVRFLCSLGLAPSPYPSPTHTSGWDSENGKGTRSAC